VGREQTVRIRVVASLATLVVATSSFVTPAFAAVRTKLVSRHQNVDAIQGDSSTFGGRAISGTGRFVVFTVDDDNLPGSDGTRDVYVRDRRNGRTRLVSQNTAGDPAEGHSSDAIAISQNGRFVAFAVDADNFRGAMNQQDVYLRNLRAGWTRLMSKTSGGEFLTDESNRPAVSATGRVVAFNTHATNLPGNDDYISVYTHHYRSGRTKLVSKTSGGVPANGDSENPSLSADGRRCSFESAADNLPGPDGLKDVFVRNTNTGKTRLVSKTSGGEHLDDFSDSVGGSMSGNGRFVAFESRATNLPGDGNSTGDVYVHSLRKGTTRLVSKTSQGVPADTDSSDPSISGRGRFITFESDAENLPGEAVSVDVFIHDRRTGRTRLLSRATSGEAGGGDSFYVSISADGRFAAFTSRADNFSGVDDNDYSNIFVRGPLR
jgi:Tol biopolymer transport system component